MEVVCSVNCDNSPRMALVRDFAIEWARHNADALHAWLANDARWRIVGDGHDGDGDDPPLRLPPVEPETLEIFTVMSHGKVASCNGMLVSGPTRIDFCHVFRFTGATKTAKVAEITSYHIQSK